MASFTCLRCLVRVPHPVKQTPWPSKRSPASRTAAFSTSTPFAMPPPAKKKTNNTMAPPARGKKTLKIKKKAFVQTGRPPAVGERKALRQRIVLSNTNALEVPGLADLNAKNMADESVRGQMLGLPDPVVDFLRAAQAFKTTQGWNLFRRPAVLVRRETVEMGSLVNSQSSKAERKTIRRVIAGEMGSGKSILLLQAMAMAFLKEWIVINIPEAQDLTNAHTEYTPLPNSSPKQYLQSTYISNLLARIAKANNPILSNLQITQSHNLPIPLQPNISLSRLADLGARDSDLAYPVFQALWTELTSPSTKEAKRPPLLLTIDGLGHLMRDSEYLNSDVRPIHAHDLVIARHFIDYLSGTRSLPNGGMVLAATSASNRPSTPAMDLALRQTEARAAGLPVPQWDPYRSIDERVLHSLRDVELLTLKGLSRDEARGVMEYYAASGMLRVTVSERFVSEKWTLAGGGIIGEIERGTVRI